MQIRDCPLAQVWASAQMILMTTVKGNHNNNHLNLKRLFCRSAKACAQQDLPETYEKVKSAVEEGSQLDEQFVSALRPGPKLKESVLVANNLY